MTEGAEPVGAPPRPAARGGGGAGGGPHCSANARAGGGGHCAWRERASRRQTGHGRPWIPPRHAVRRPRLSHGRRRRAGSGSGPCARCPDDAARPPSARPGPGPVAWGAGGGPRARLWALRAPLPLRPGARRRLPRQLLRPRTADARARAAHPRGCHRAVSNPPPRNADRTVAMAPCGREDRVGRWGPSGERDVGRPPRACTLLGEAGRAGRRPGGPRRAWARPRPLEGETECGPGLSQGEAPAQLGRPN